MVILNLKSSIHKISLLIPKGNSKILILGLFLRISMNELKRYFSQTLTKDDYLQISGSIFESVNIKFYLYFDITVNSLSSSLRSKNLLLALPKLFEQSVRINGII